MNKCLIIVITSKPFTILQVIIILDYKYYLQKAKLSFSLNHVIVSLLFKVLNHSNRNVLKILRNKGRKPENNYQRDQRYAFKST